MTTTPLTCARVDADGLAARYAAGTLSDNLAEAFEAHYFGCTRCWDEVRRVTEIRDALATLPADAAAPRRRIPRWWPVAAAAGIAALLLLLVQPRKPVTPGGTDITRGGGAVWAARAATSGDAASLVWAAVAGADLYRVRLLAADGRLVVERSTRDTALAVAADSVPAGAAWEVTALDSLREVLRQSPLVPARTR